MEKALKRETWVDNTKVLACILVVLGHFFQSMTKASLVSDGAVYTWFNQSIYYFHVPLFFICSGFLYQRNTHISDLRSWGNFALKKLLTLGVPYLVFSMLTWVLKRFFSGSVNEQIGGLADTLLVHPTSPYWYLYCLIALFLLIPLFRSEKHVIVVCTVSVGLKLLAVNRVFFAVPLVRYIEENAIWFSMGMVIAYFPQLTMAIKQNMHIGAVLVLIFLGGSVYAVSADVPEIYSFGMGLLACSGIVLLVGGASAAGTQSKALAFAARYTMPVFVMHTLFAAPVRVVLMKVGVHNGAAHVAVGLIVSFSGPVIAAMIMERIKGLDFVLYPGKYVKF